MLGLGVGIPKLVYPAPVAGYVNSQSLNLDGTGDIIETNLTEAQIQTLMRGTGFTVSMWVNVAYSSSFHFFGYTDTGNVLAGTFDLRYVHIIPTLDYVLASLKLGGQSADQLMVVNPTFTDVNNTWQHIAYSVVRGVDDSTDGSHTLYWNGSQAGTADTQPKNFAEATTVSSGRGLAIGGQNSNGTMQNNMTGLLDEVAIFNTGLDASNIAAIYNSGVPFDLTADSGSYRSSSALHSYYRFEGSTQSDLSQDLGSTGVTIDIQGNPTTSTSVPS